MTEPRALDPRGFVALYGLDAVLTEEDDPSLWEAVLRKRWWRPYGPKLSLLGSQVRLVFGVAATPTSGWLEDHSWLCTLYADQKWSFVREDARHLRPVPLIHDEVVSSENHELLIYRPSFGRSKTLAQISSHHGNKMDYHMQINQWERTGEGVWAEGKTIMTGVT